MVEYDIKKFVKILEKIKNTYSSLNEMARQSNVTSSYLSKIMAFKYEEPPSPKILKSIAKNSHDITSYMDLMYICGYIDNKDIFEYYNKVFTANSIINGIRKSEIFDTVEAEKIIDTLEKEDTNYFYKMLEAKTENLKLKFFAEMKKRNNCEYINKMKDTKTQVIDNANKVPVLENLSQDMLILKNKKIKLDCKSNMTEFYTYFSNKYMKKEYNYIATEIKDNSMNLKFNKQDIILIQLQEDLKQGEIGIVSVNDKQLVRRYRKENNYIILEALSNDENYITEIYNMDIDNIKILGKVVAYQGKI